tara:strand:- start:466 stop:825 length:360 start_codon:yes stop_codon:yes gene_type:complete
MSEISTVTGTVIKIGETESFGSGDFTKRIAVIEIADGQYTQEIPIEAVKDKCAMFDSISLGDTVTANVNLRGSAWKDRHFLSLQCRKIVVDSAGAGDAPNIPGVGDADAPAEFDSEIPF